MKKRKYRVRKGRVVLAASIFLLLAGLIVFLCVRPHKKGNNLPEEDAQTVDPSQLVNEGEYINITQEDCNLYVGTSLLLSCTSNPEEYADKVVWQSDSDCVSVDQNGRIMVNSQGTAAITAVYGVLSDAIVINAIEKNNEDGIISQLPVYDVDSDGKAVIVKPAETQPDTQDGNSGNEGNDGNENNTPATEPSKDNTGNIETTSGGNNNGGAGQNETIASIGNKQQNKEIITQSVIDNGFTKYIDNTYIFLEDDNYLGEVIINDDYAQIYVMTRTSRFDTAVKNVIGSLAGSYNENVYSMLVSAREDTTFSQGGHKMRIVAPVDGGHSQLMLYY